jgi:hypothetical protein
MSEQLNDSDLDIIIEALGEYRMNIQNYGHYPSYEAKQKQLERLESAIEKIRTLKAKS